MRGDVYSPRFAAAATKLGMIGDWLSLSQASTSGSGSVKSAIGRSATVAGARSF